MGIKNSTEGINFAINSIKSEEAKQTSWYLATNIEDKEQAVNDYTRNFLRSKILISTALIFSNKQ